MRGRPDVPWMTKRIKNMLRRKQRLFNRARKSNKEEDKSAFRHLRKIIKKDLNKSHMEYVTGLLDFGQIARITNPSARLPNDSGPTSREERGAV